MKKHLCFILAFFMILLNLFSVTVQANISEEVIFYVRAEDDPSKWQNKDPKKIYTDLQEAIDIAEKNAPAQVWVAVGTYSPKSSPNIPSSNSKEELHFALKNQVTIIGGFAGNENVPIPTNKIKNNTDKLTVLSGGDIVNHVFYHPETSALNDTAVLDNVVISDSASKEINGGGMYNSESSPTILNTVFKNNKAAKGAGIYNSYSSPTLKNCTFEDNKAFDGGAIYNLNSFTKIYKSKFYTNHSSNYGGAIYNEDSSPEIKDTKFVSNSVELKDGGAIYNIVGNPIIENCSFSDNISLHYGGAIAAENGELSLINNIFEKNKGLYGGAIYISNNKLTAINSSFNMNDAKDGAGMYIEKTVNSALINNSFARNNATENGGGIFVYLSKVHSVNNIFKENIGASSGGGLYNTGGEFFGIGNIFVGNHSIKGGSGIFSASVSNADSRLNLVNATITGNTCDTPNNGAGVYSSDYNTEISNSILSGNKDDTLKDNFYKDTFTTEPVFNNTIASNLFFHNYQTSEETNFTATKHISYDYELIGDDNPAKNIGDNILFKNIFNTFCNDTDPNQKIKSYDFSGKDRILEELIDLGALEMGVKSEEINAPAPLIMATSDNKPYLNSMKSNNPVFIETSYSITDMENYPLARKNAYLPFEISFEKKGVQDIFKFETVSTESEKFNFWSFLESFSNSGKITFETNIDKNSPKVLSAKFDGLENNINTPLLSNALEISFSKNIRTTGAAKVSISAVDIDKDGNLTENEIADLTKQSNFNKNIISIPLSNLNLRYGQKYSYNIEGFKDDFNNVMEAYKGYFVTEISPDNFEPTISALMADKTVFEDTGGALNLTVAGGNLAFFKDLSIYAVNTTPSSLIVTADGEKRVATIYMEENKNDTPKNYTFGLKADATDTDKFVNITVKGKPFEIIKTITDFSATPPLEAFVDEEIEEEPEIFESISYEIIVNGSPYKTQAVDTSKNNYLLDINSVDGSSVVVIGAEILENISKQNKDFKLEIKSPGGTMFLPVKLIKTIPNFEELLKSNGLTISDVYFKIRIEDVSSDQRLKEKIAEDFEDGNYSDKSINFTVEMIGKEGKSIGETENLTEEIICMLPASSETSIGASAVYFMSNLGKEIAYVPYKFVVQNGERAAKIKIKSGGSYFMGKKDVEFNDIDISPHKKEIKLAAALDLVSGTEDNFFEPNREITKAEFVHMLVNPLNIRKPLQELPYMDVRTDSWYYDSIAKARSVGILSGFNGSTLNPEAPINREEMASIVNAVVSYEKYRTPYKNMTLENIFVDHEKIAENFRPDVKAVVENGIMQGVESDVFGPKFNVNRGEACAVLIRLLRTIERIN